MAVPEIHIKANWPDRADTRGWRIAEVIALDENGNRVLLQILSASKPVNLTRRKFVAISKLREIEAELREQASGSQDGYLLDVANRMREALKAF